MPITGTRALARSTVRSGPDATSPKIGHHVKGTVVDVVQETCNSDGLVVLQTTTAPAGWVKMVTSKGKMLLALHGGEQKPPPGALDLGMPHFQPP